MYGEGGLPDGLDEVEVGGSMGLAFSFPLEPDVLVSVEEKDCVVSINEVSKVLEMEVGCVIVSSKKFCCDVLPNASIVVREMWLISIQYWDLFMRSSDKSSKIKSNLKPSPHELTRESRSQM